MSEQDDRENKPQLFQDNALAVAQSTDAAAVARATQEIQAALVIAQRFPRDEVKARTRIMEACKRKGLAEVAEYEYSRGGTRIIGPTIDLLMAVANRWGNLLYGWDEVDRHNGESRVRCWAWDTQSNSRAERTFQIKHWRDTQAGGYAINDERDIYELISNFASRRVRACLEQIIDQDVVNDAVEQCRKTLKEGEKRPIKDRAVEMCLAFADHGVTQAMIEKRLGNKLEAVSENQIASLRRIFRALKDGVGQRDDYFKPDAATPAMDPPAPKDEAGKPQADAGKGKPETKPEPEPFNQLKALRGLCKANKVKEGELLGWLAQTGETDGSIASLEELQMSKPDVVKRCVDQWAELLARIQGA